MFKSKFKLSYFQTQFFIGFTSIWLVTLFLVVITIGLMASIIGLGTRIMDVAQPTRSVIFNLRAGINESMYIATSDLYSSQIERKVEWENCWEFTIPAPLDSLKTYEKDWTNPTTRNAFRILLKTVDDIKLLQNDLIVYRDRFRDLPSSVSDNSFRETRDRLISTHDSFERLAEKIVDNQIVIIKDTARRAYNKRDNFITIEITLLILALFIGLLIAWYFSYRLKKHLQEVSQKLKLLSKGNLPDKLKVDNTEFKTLSDSFSDTIHHLQNLKTFADHVGNMDFDTKVSAFGAESEMGAALEKMRKSLHLVSQEDGRRNWLNKGISNFVEILRSNQEDLQLLGKEVIMELVKYVNGNQGGLFALNYDDEDHEYFELISFYAYGRHKYIQKSINATDGLIGQAYFEKATIHLTEIPEDYIQVSSGLGESNPKSILIVPLRVNEEIFGIVELASFHEFDKFQIEFVERLGEYIAGTFSNVRNNEKTRILLDNSRRQAEAMREQEEVMRQNYEELKIAQEEMQRRQVQLEESKARSNAFFEGALNPIVSFREDETIMQVNPAAENLFGLSANELLGKKITILIGEAYEKAFGNMMGVITRSSHGSTLELDYYIHTFETGEEKLHICYMRDLTERNHDSRETDKKLAEVERLERQLKALQSKENNIPTVGELMKQIIQQLPQPSYWKDQNFKYIFCNAAFLKRMGLENEGSLIGKTDFDLREQNIASKIQVEEKEIFDSQTPKIEEITSESNEKGETFYTRYSKIPLMDKTGEVVGLFGIHEDFTSYIHSQKVAEHYNTQVEKVRKAIESAMNGTGA